MTKLMYLSAIKSRVELSYHRADVGIGEFRPMRVERRNPQNNCPFHDHDFHEVSLITQGTGLHRTETTVQALEVGSVVVVAPGQKHAYEKTKNLHLINVYYLPEWFLDDVRAMRQNDGILRLFFPGLFFQKPLGREPTHFFLSRQDQKRVRSDLLEIEREEAKSGGDSTFFVHCTFLRTLYLCARAFNQVHPAVSGPMRTEIRKSIDWMEAQILEGKPFCSAEACRRAGLSVRHWRRLFGRELGIDPRGFFQKRRIQIACRFLFEGDLRITEIAHRLGFVDAPHFCAHFKKVYGKSPHQYRKSLQNAQSFLRTESLQGGVD